MDTYYVPKLGWAELASGLGWLACLCVLASGCVGGPPTRVQIQPGQAWSSDQASLEQPASLTVTTFNVWGLPSWVNWASGSRFRKIADTLPQIGSDVVLMQEVWTRHCFDELSQEALKTNRNWWTASARRRGTFLGQNGLLTLSRYPIISASVRHFSSARLPDSLMHKGALKVTIDAGGQRFNIWNVHLQDGESSQVRSQQIAELIKWIEQSDDGQTADIVGGDFNFTPGSKEFEQFASAIGPSVHELAGKAAEPTWDGLKLKGGTAQALDHIFIRTKQPANEIHARPRRIFAANRVEDRLSDHMGMEARLEFGGLENLQSLGQLDLFGPTATAWTETSALTR
jgi:endonuclease/exonuclease/phosphatase family metal-dependent hydrolase